MKILEIEDLTKTFGGIEAVSNFSLNLKKGKIGGLIGPNGAGKTTLFNLITGYLKPDSGEIKFSGRSIENEPSHEIARKGVIRTFQIMKPLSRMSVLENLMLAESDQVGESVSNLLFRPDEVKKREDSIRERALEILDFFDLENHKDEYAGSLSGGQRRLLELTRSLMASPTLLMLDEPTGGVNPTLAKDILNRLRELNDEGLTIFMVEHNIETIMSLSDIIFVMAEGEKIAEGSPSDIRQNERVIDAYLGG